MNKKEQLQLIEDLITGKVFERLQVECLRLEQCREETAQRLEGLLGADRAIVKETLREILATGQKRKLPLLEKMISEEIPQHKQVPLLAAAMRARIPVWIFGDTGSGKTTAAMLAAGQLDLQFRLISVCPTTTKSELFGYRDAAGKYHGTAFREIFERGGVFLIDEIDNGNPSILSVLNTALANDYCAFPDKLVKRHQNAIFVAAANTIGKGADIRYIGRNALDATTLDRFVFVRMDVDENLEEALTKGKWDRRELADINLGGEVKPEEWLKFIRDVRRVCRDLGIEHIVSPRANLYGQRLINAGVGRTHLEDMCVWKGIRETDKRKIKERLS